jgi:ubiquinone/menaquinone biosynthesis C-methylase UbiE
VAAEVRILKMGVKTELKKQVWSKESYYTVIEKSGINIKQPGIKRLLGLTKKSKKVLDLGCGEGTRLHFLTIGKPNGTGVDISETAIRKAKKKYPRLNFIVADIENLPFERNRYDMVYSAYVFEHMNKPEKVLQEAKRVLAQGGILAIISPNYGAPNRSSPPGKENRVLKLIYGLLRDFYRLLGKQNSLNWMKVKPLADAESYQMDWDTVVEPYIGSLIPYLKKLDFKILYWSVFWGEELRNAKILQKLLRYIGEKNIYPFKYWGPQLMVVAQKT